MADDLVPVLKSEIVVGQALRWAVYDAQGVLLLNRGMVVETEHQLRRLLEQGLFHRHRERAAAGPPEPAEAGEGRAESGRPGEVSLPFDQIKLMPGDEMRLQPLLEGQTERYPVRVIGMLKGKSVLVTAPTVDGKLIFIRDGQTFLVRAFSGLNACAFKTRVLKAQLIPFPYLHLAWPDEVRAMLIRKSVRAPIDLIVSVHEVEDGRQTAAGRMTDISVGGACILSGQPLGGKGDTIHLAFKVRLADLEEYVKTPAIIRSAGEKEAEDGRRQVATGVQFGELRPAPRLIIMNLVYQYLLKENG